MPKIYIKLINSKLDKLGKKYLIYSLDKKSVLFNNNEVKGTINAMLAISNKAPKEIKNNKNRIIIFSL